MYLAVSQYFKSAYTASKTVPANYSLQMVAMPNNKVLVTACYSAGKATGIRLQLALVCKSVASEAFGSDSLLWVEKQMLPSANGRYS